MEVTAVLSTFRLYLHTQGIYYTKYLGDGDSKAYQRVSAEKPYGPNITRLGCKGHVHKRMVTSLRNHMKENIGTKLHESKHLGCRHSLVQSEVHKLHNYYDVVIRRNVNRLEAIEESCVGCFFSQTDNK